MLTLLFVFKEPYILICSAFLSTINLWSNICLPLQALDPFLFETDFLPFFWTRKNWAPKKGLGSFTSENYFTPLRIKYEIQWSIPFEIQKCKYYTLNEIQVFRCKIPTYVVQFRKTFIGLYFISLYCTANVHTVKLCNIKY